MLDGKVIDKAYATAHEVGDRKIQGVIGLFYDDMISDKELEKNELLKEFITKYEIEKQVKQALEKVLEVEFARNSTVSTLYNGEMPGYFGEIKFKESHDTRMLFTGLFSDMIASINTIIKEMKLTFNQDPESSKVFDEAIGVATFVYQIKIVPGGMVLTAESYEEVLAMKPIVLSTDKECIIRFIEKVGVDGGFEDKVILQRYDTDEDNDDLELDMA